MTSLLTGLRHGLEENVTVLQRFLDGEGYHFEISDGSNDSAILFHEIETSLMKLRKLVRDFKDFWDTYGKLQEEVSRFFPPRTLAHLIFY